MSAKGKKRDPNLDHPGVQAYREIIHLTPNWIQREDIAATVRVNGNGELELWRKTLVQFMREGNNPKRVDWLCDRFETALRNSNRTDY